MTSEETAEASSVQVLPAPRLSPIGVFCSGLDFVRMARAKEIVSEIEELGYGALWYPDSGERESLVKASLFLSATEHLVVATGIASIWTRHPRVMNGGAKAVNDAFPGRFLLGVGASHRHVVEGVLGRSYAQPFSAMRNYLAEMDEITETASQARPARVLAALGPRMLELSRDRAEGAHPYLVTPSHTARARAILGPDKILAVEQAVTLSNDRDVVRSRGRAHLASYLRAPNYANNWLRLGFRPADFEDGGSDRLVDALVVGGREEAILGRVLEHFDAGADHVCIQALGDNYRELPRDQWRALAPGLVDVARGFGTSS